MMTTEANTEPFALRPVELSASRPDTQKQKATRRHYAPLNQGVMFTDNELLVFLELPVFLNGDRVNSQPHDPLSQEAVAALIVDALGPDVQATEDDPDRPVKHIAAFEQQFLNALVAIAKRVGAQPTKTDLDNAFSEWERRRMAKLERESDERLRIDVRNYLRECELERSA